MSGAPAEIDIVAIDDVSDVFQDVSTNFSEMSNNVGEVSEAVSSDISNSMQQTTSSFSTFNSKKPYLRTKQTLFQKVANTEKEACQLIDAGFDFVCDFDGT